MNRFLLIFIIIFLISSCAKSNEEQIGDIVFDNNEYGFDLFKKYTNEEKEFIYSVTGRKNWKSNDFYLVLLGNDTILCKINSVDKESNEIDKNVDYDIYFINIKEKKTEKIISDKYSNIILLPLVWNKTRQINYDGDNKIRTSWYSCFILQIKHGKYIKDNTYRLIYIDEFNKSRKEYEYKNTFWPEYIDIIKTPNFFIVGHLEMGEEYILINKETGEYTIIDSEEEEGH